MKNKFGKVKFKRNCFNMKHLASGLQVKIAMDEKHCNVTVGNKFYGRIPKNTPIKLLLEDIDSHIVVHGSNYYYNA